MARDFDGQDTIEGIANECFTNGKVISYKGENYYKACDEFVYDRPEGGQTFCVKRVGHPGTLHEDYDGRTKGYDAARELAEAIRLTVEYLGNDVLPAKDGWSWFDALHKYSPSMAYRFQANPIHFPKFQKHGFQNND